ncbi:771c346e-1cbe-47af-a5bb-7680f15ccb0e-CDS [Sclerotinia trifoliorum]|uniref:771c346e-1cbe-47af-a5bb-7680f15ccb0e-CDS n=1 Tax=Sclerotinia trifoliorum TaxID=28548 RepID=A0A8H2VWK6_9HELO|nr:771c346e-1cbe-47af-a5bb-7680f15ccb0e-CDS [Sclerotinia trifoliorum]
MVLEDSSSKEANESFDSIPTSDSDPYASAGQGQGGGQGTGRQTYRVDGSTIPKPLPILGPLFGFNDAFLSKIINARVQNAAKVTKRPLRQEEIDALAFHTAKIIRINSFAPVAGLSAGIYRATQTAATFRFPFYQPNLETFNSNVFPHPRMPYIRGFPAIIAWHTFRGLCYCYVGQTVSKILFGGYAASVGAVGQMGDKRLKDIVKATTEEVARTQKNLPSPAGIPRPRMKPGQGQSQSGNTQDHDDASPTGGADWYGDDGASGSTQSTPQTFPPMKPQRQFPTQAPAQAPAQEEEKPFDLFDDASPTSGQGMNTNTSTSQSSKPTSGSAWDRVRRGEKPASNINTPSQSRKSGWATNTPKTSEVASTDTFAFSKTEEERNLAQLEAQKEFDARVEKERRGGDFSSAGDQKRW